MSDYAAQRIRQIRAQFGARKPGRPTKGAAARKAAAEIPSAINLHHPVHRLANNYIIKTRKTAPMQATWFDVHDAFVAGFSAGNAERLRP